MRASAYQMRRRAKTGPAPEPSALVCCRMKIRRLVTLRLAALTRTGARGSALGHRPLAAAGLDVPPAATEGLDLLYAGHPDKALDLFRGIEAAQPDHPLGYLLEAEARWWQIYCETCAIKWNMIDAWPQPRRAGRRLLPGPFR